MALRFEPSTPTAADVRAYREETGSGMIEAKAELIRRARSTALADLMANGTAEEKIDWILRRYAENRNLDVPCLFEK